MDVNTRAIGSIPSHTLSSSPKKSGLQVIASQYEHLDHIRRGETSAEVVLVKKTKNNKNETFGIKFLPLRSPSDPKDSGYRELRILLALQKLIYDRKTFDQLTLGYRPVTEWSKCKLPVPFVDNKQLEGSDQLLCLIMEYAQQDLSMLKNVSLRSYKEILFQILWALYIAQKEYHFVHHDLHKRNVLVSGLSESQCIAYRDRQEMWFITGHKAMIADFGHSRIVLDGNVLYNQNAPFQEIYLTHIDTAKVADDFNGNNIDWTVSSNQDKPLLTHLKRHMRSGTSLRKLLHHPFFQDLKVKMGDRKDITFIASDGKVQDMKKFVKNYAFDVDNSLNTEDEWEKADISTVEWEENTKRRVVAPDRLEPETPSPLVRKRPKRSLDPAVIASRKPVEKKILGELFNGTTFVLTGFELESTLEWKNLPKQAKMHQICKTITANHGTLIDSLETMLSFKISKSVDNITNIVLISEKEQKTPKYLVARALGIPCVHTCWIEHSLEIEELVSLENYKLPQGYSFEKKCFVKQTNEDGRNLFNSLRVDFSECSTTEVQHSRGQKKVYSEWKSDWKCVLRAAGAKIVDRIWTAPNRLDCIITQGKPDPRLITHAKSNKISMVNTEWVIQCIVNNTMLDYDSSFRYHYSYDSSREEIPVCNEAYPIGGVKPKKEPQPSLEDNELTMNNENSVDSSDVEINLDPNEIKRVEYLDLDDTTQITPLFKNEKEEIEVPLIDKRKTKKRKL